MDATGFMQMLGHKDFTLAYPMIDTSMQKKVSKEQLKQVWGQLEGQFGSWQQVKLVSTEHKNEMDVSLLDNEFEKAIVTMKVVMNSSRMVLGFTVQGVKQKEQNSAPLPAYCKEETATIKTTDGDLKGTIVIPANNFKGKIVLIIAGSGPTDRNGNNILGVTARSYQLLAYALAEKGIASLRYDKRMVGESTGFSKKPEATTFDDFVTDAAACMHQLESDKRFSQIYICGHSEGSLVGELIASAANTKKDKPAGFISLCGPGLQLDKTMERQLIENAHYDEATVKPIIAAIKKDTVMPKLSQGLESIFVPQNMVFMHSIFQYDPAAQMKKVKINVLIVSGSHDIQVSPADAEALRKAKPDARLLIVSNMNHVLKDAPADMVENSATYKNADLPLSDGLVAGLAGFINSNQ